jgi:hypothetical protein
MTTYLYEKDDQARQRAHGDELTKPQIITLLDDILDDCASWAQPEVNTSLQKARNLPNQQQHPDWKVEKDIKAPFLQRA